MYNCVKLGTLTRIQTGKLDANASSTDGEYPFFTCSREVLRIATYSYDCECVLVAGNGDLNVKYYAGKFDAYQRTYIIESIDKSKLLAKYLYFFLDIYVEVLRTQSIGGVIKYIKLGNLADALIPLPSIEKQAEIVDCLETCDVIIDRIQQELTKLDELVKSRFVEMFGNYVYEKKLWQVCKVGDVAGTIDPQPSHRTPPVSADGVPYIGIADCNYEHCIIDFNNARKVGFSVLKEHKVRYSLHDGDFIIGKIGTIGKPFFIPAIQNYTLSANTVLIQPIHQMVEPSYLFVFFQSEYMNRIIEEEQKSTSQPAFGIQKVRQIDMPLPPMQLQRRFADLYYQVDKSKLAVKQSLEKLETLKKSLMQQYFG